MSATTYKWAVKTSSKVEQVSKLLKLYCIANDIKFSDTSILVTAYIAIYGLNDKVREHIIKSDILGTEASLDSEIHKIKRMGLLEGRGERARIARKIVPEGVTLITPQTLIIINLDNR